MKVTLNNLELVESGLGDLLFSGYSKQPASNKSLYTKLLKVFAGSKVTTLKKHFAYTTEEINDIKKAIKKYPNDILKLVVTEANDAHIDAYFRFTFGTPQQAANRYQQVSIGTTGTVNISGGQQAQQQVDDFTDVDIIETSEGYEVFISNSDGSKSFNFTADVTGKNMLFDPENSIGEPSDLAFKVAAEVLTSHIDSDSDFEWDDEDADETLADENGALWHTEPSVSRSDIGYDVKFFGYEEENESFTIHYTNDGLVINVSGYNESIDELTSEIFDAAKAEISNFAGSEAFSTPQQSTEDEILVDDVTWSTTSGSIRGISFKFDHVNGKLLELSDADGKVIFANNRVRKAYATTYTREAITAIENEINVYMITNYPSNVANVQQVLAIINK